jgi:hypothetical protein
MNVQAGAALTDVSLLLPGRSDDRCKMIIGGHQFLPATKTGWRGGWRPMRPRGVLRADVRQSKGKQSGRSLFS